MQCINAQGQKQTFGPRSGNAYICGNTLDKSLRFFIVEGWADAFSMVHHIYKGDAAAFACMGKDLRNLAKRVESVFDVETIIVWDKDGAA